MPHPWANAALLAFVAVAVSSGVAGLLDGSTTQRWVFWAHAIAAYAIVVLLLPKTEIVVRSLRRRRRRGSGPEHRVFLVMLGLLVVVLATGLTWVLAGPLYVGVSLINLHAYLAIALAGLLVLHVARRGYALRIPAARGRGAALRLVGVAVGGAALWGAERGLERALGRDRVRRYTGSYERGSFGGRFPAVIWFRDRRPQVDEATYSLRVHGAVERELRLDLAALRGRDSSQLRAKLDCTGGWFTEQDWQGVSVADLLAEAGVRGGARSVLVRSRTGYARRLPLDEARGCLLAVAATGVPLRPGNGAPLRLVAPGRRGYDWVKWVDEVEVLDTPAWLQSPLPLS